jgi:dinuclear metal center YbgI/SA1388 family protein
VSPKLADVIAALEAVYPPHTAESWDAVGLVCGDPDEPVSKVMVCVDPVESTVEDAIEQGAQLLIAHHPLMLRGVNGVPKNDPKGALVHRLIRNNAALFCAHTNADSALPGVSDALAEKIGLTVTGPLTAAPEEPLLALTTWVPHEDAEIVLQALFEAGAGNVGEYHDVAWVDETREQFRPGAKATPVIGQNNELTRHAVARVEVVLDKTRRKAVVQALLDAHPYEQVGYTLHEFVEVPSNRGIGRIGELSEAEPLFVFTQRVADALPGTAWGVRAAGNPQRMIKRVAVCGGAGDSYLKTAARARVDAYVTADLRHHPASEHLAAGGPALVDVSHWASEWPWCEQAADVVRRAFGGTVEVLVSTRRTDPWTVGATSRTGGNA